MNHRLGTRMNRWNATAVHLSISATIAGIMVAIMLLLWYPGVYFEAMGGDVLLLLLVGCDVVIGPLITLIIFKPGKPGLKLDLATIGCVQLAALAYGSYTMFIARPVFTVFAVDRFEVVAANQIRPEELAKATNPEFGTLSLTGPRLVAATLPDDQNERVAISLAAANGGEDVKQLPRLYVPYEQVKVQVAARSRPMGVLATRSSAFPEMMKRLKQATGKSEDDLGFLPMSARNKSMSVVVDRRSGKMEDIFPINPW